MNIEEALNNKSGYAFMVLEEGFWIDILNKSLKKTEGNVTIASEVLGISPTTFRQRCKRHGVDINSYKTKVIKERKDRIETRKYWKSIIKRAFTDKTISISEAAKNLGWPRSTLHQRMRAVGITRNSYKKWNLNIEGIKP